MRKCSRPAAHSWLCASLFECVPHYSVCVFGGRGVGLSELGTLGCWGEEWGDSRSRLGEALGLEPRGGQMCAMDFADVSHDASC